MAYQGGDLKSTSVNGVKMYTLASQQQSHATWIASKKLRKDKKGKPNTELLQDLRFETATTKIKATPDGEYLIASGIYPPQIKVYELRELSLKFERHLDSEIVDFQILDDDYSKLAFLCADRSVVLHAKYGKHYSLRIPRMGRDITYDHWSCDLLCAASSPDLYRINLEQGRFLSSLSTQSPALNVVSRSEFHGLVACGGEDGAVECFDLRMRSPIGRINAVAATGDTDQEVTAVAFDGSGGFAMAVGSSVGQVLLYDLRSSNPVRIKDHMYGTSILDIKWHRTLNSDNLKIISSDNHVVRIWDPDTGEGMTSIEPLAGRINDTCVCKESGLILLGLDCSQIPAYFIPSLGPAPKWCAYLESFTEELEEGGQTVIYDDYKFLTKEDLEKLNATSLIGSNLLRAYMHGFFIHHHLYKKLKAIATPFTYDEYIEQKKKDKLEAELKSRITRKIKLPKVNRNLAANLLDNDEAEDEKNDDDEDKEIKKKSKKKGLNSSLLKDDRFKAMFENKEFEIDEQSLEYLALHPMAAKKQTSLVEEHFQPVEEDHGFGDSDAASQSSDEEADDQRKTKSQAPRLYEVKDERHAEAFFNRVSLAAENSLSLGERGAALQQDQQVSGISNDVKVGPGGSREISFLTRSSAKYVEDEEDKEVRHGKRRGIQSLGLKPDRHSFKGRGRGRGGSRGRGRRTRR
ncbi:hypothetical protein MLD38_008959 [Melastoma candidum]|uniref:Uncharacterized protein n=1 Tax=Melastoma candidum TaxID=119954 RepID=A0ACB9RW71_9MYRT|nr:hypothetical protein MLD38_008959 [Melastoma candidum]